jgi:hypothetical protein
MQELARYPLVLRKYSSIGLFALLFYLPVIPMILIIGLSNRLTKNSENQLCFDWQIIARKQ